MNVLAHFHELMKAFSEGYDPVRKFFVGAEEVFGNYINLWQIILYSYIFAFIL